MARRRPWISSHAPWRAICPNICRPSHRHRRKPPGAAGLTATNYVYALGPQDGTVVAANRPFAPVLPLLDPKNAPVDPRKLQWMPSAATGYRRLRCRRAPSTRLDDNAQNPAQSGCCEFHGASRFPSAAS